MIRLLKHRLSARRDDGAMLIFAIIIITTIALVVGTVLTRGDGSLRATVALRSVASSSYTADAAANVAINDLRRGLGSPGFAANVNESGFNNSLDGIGCFGNSVGNGGTDTLSLPGFYPATGSLGKSSAYVECAGEAGTGQQGSPVPINNSNKPGYAIVTLNGNLTATDALKVHGGIYANGNISGAGTVTVDAGDVRATGTCANTTATGTATKQCGGGVAAIADPGYTDELGGAVPTYQKPPTTCSTGVAIFNPGYYDSAAAMNTATNLCNVLWFKPGNYYFDFHNDGCANVCPSGVFGTGGNTWNITGQTVVGGTPLDAAGNVLTQPSGTAASVPMPGSCQSPITDVNASGVQFVFGGSSRLFVDKNSRVELCATYHSTRPPVELLGLKTGSTPSSATANGLAPAGVSSTSSLGASWGLTLTSGNLASGGGTANWTTTSASAQTTTVTATGFGSSIPAGSVVTAATVHVVHQDVQNANSANGSAKLTVGGSVTAVHPINATAASAAGLVSDDWALSGTDLTNLQKEVHDNGYSSASIDYIANASQNNKTAKLDAITLDLTYYTPVLRGETGTCIAGGAGACQLISTDTTGNNKIEMYLQGTTYTPLADVSIVLSNFSAEVAKFGIVTRQLEFDVNTGNPRWTGPVFEIPDNSPGYGYQNTTVDLKVHVCLGSATVPASCQSNTPALTSRVQLWDPTGVPVANQRQISVLSWSRTS